MNIAEYLDKTQPLLARQFASALSSRHLSHAYLLSGEPGSPLLELAKYLAKSLVCEHPTPFADQTCSACHRIEDGNYADIEIFDGYKDTIKKDDIQTLESSFERTPMEKAGKLIYILHLVENMTPEAINSLLKFLEEPHQEVYAFLTCENETKVLETIISRSQKLRVLPAPREYIIQQALIAGITPSDAELLSFFQQDEKIMHELIESDFYPRLIEVLRRFLETLPQSYDKACFIIEHELVERYTKKEQLRFLIDVLAILIEALGRLENGQASLLPSYDKILTPLIGRFRHIEKLAHEITLCRGRIELNLNAALLLDHVFNLVMKEYIR